VAEHTKPSRIVRAFKDVAAFPRMGRITLRAYQEAAALAIVDSVLNDRGLSFVVMFPRQSGKNELQAQIESYLLARLADTNAEMVKVSPTFKPQTENAMRRLERALKSNLITRTLWTKQQGYIYRISEAVIYFFSGEPTSNIVGATASTLLSLDEAQDITIPKYDKDIAPMAASTNATRVFWGTAWTSTTLLARELRAAREAQAKDGVQRVFVLDADQVAAEVPAYGRFVAEQVKRLGRSNPMVRTQYYSEEIDAEGGLFPPQRTALMRGAHDHRSEPESGKTYAFLIDVAGEDEEQTGDIATAALSNPARDATALTIVEVDVSTLSDPLIAAPTYRALCRSLWVGTKHTTIFSAIRSLADLWRPQHIVIDATGIGAGLSSFLDKAYPGRVLPFIFNTSTKSKLGWDFLAIVDTGRWKDWTAGGAASGAPGLGGDREASRPFLGRDNGVKISGSGADNCHHLQAQFFIELAAVQYEILPGPNKTIRWSVPDNTKDPDTGEPIHDDLVISAALAAVLDTEIDWYIQTETIVIHAPDVMEVLDRGF
jgi:hypothetical protein